jgi:hypothetical protein
VKLKKTEGAPSKKPLKKGKKRISGLNPSKN